MLFNSPSPKIFAKKIVTPERNLILTKNSDQRPNLIKNMKPAKNTVTLSLQNMSDFIFEFSQDLVPSESSTTIQYLLKLKNPYVEAF